MILVLKGADNADLEDFQAGSPLCRPAVTFLYVATSVSGACVLSFLRHHWKTKRSLSGNLCLLFSYFLTGIGTVGLGGSRGHPDLLFPGLPLIYTT